MRNRTTRSQGEMLIGAILAGGASRRMGAAKHALALPGGRTFANAIYEALSPLCDEVVTLAPATILAGVRNVPDRAAAAGEGPAAGIDALLAATDANAYLICACDQPLVTTEILDRLISGTPQPMRAAVLQLSEAPSYEHFPLFLRRDSREAVAGFLARGERRIGALLTILEPHVVLAPPAWRMNLRNINTPDELPPC